ncbi:MAG: hypothetical protein R2715_21915 [Ilumatobacteraceae bacterium]
MASRKRTAFTGSTRIAAALASLRNAPRYYERGLERDRSNYYFLLNVLTTARLVGLLTGEDGSEAKASARSLLPVARYHAQAAASDDRYAVATLARIGLHRLRHGPGRRRPGRGGHPIPTDDGSGAEHR